MRPDQLTETDREMLRFALDVASDVMYEQDGFTDENHASIDRLRQFAGLSPEDQAAETAAAADYPEEDRWT